MTDSENVILPKPRCAMRRGPGGTWLQFTDPVRILQARTLDEVLPVVRAAEEATQRRGLHAAGFISYESAPAFDPSLPSKGGDPFPLAWFGLFRAPVEADSLPRARNPFPPLSWRPSVSREGYLRCFHKIKEYIESGDSYQVNLSYRLRALLDGDPWEFFLSTMARNAPYSAFVDAGEWVVCSASPELFFRTQGDIIESRPMKGTAARGLWYEDDQQRAESLRTSGKDRAENVMIVDMVRNDLGRIAELGSVRVPELFSVERHPTVWQMTSTVQAHTRAPLTEILKALFPPASITGAPKRRTMQIIAELETTPRRVYTGAIGFLGPDRQGLFNVAIRTVLAHRPTGQAEYGVGGGIVWDSRPSGEIDECAVKTRILTRRSPDFELLETIAWSPGKGYALLDHHLRRLAQSAEYFSFGVDMDRIRDVLSAEAARLPAVLHRVRLLVSADGAVSIDSAAIDPREIRFPDVLLAAQPIDSGEVFLYHKTTHRRPYEEVLRSRPGFGDVLMFNEKGEVTETTIANVAFEMHGRLCTPPVRSGLLPGTYRRWLLESGRLTERVVTVDEALQCGEVYLMNSVRGMQKVRIIT